jgi:hypothetical protein
MALSKYGLQDWFAERIRFVPFAPSRADLRPRLALFRYAMPWYLRGFLVLVGVLMIGAAGIVLAAVGLLFWAIVTAS